MSKDLYERLRKRRQELAEKIRQPVYMVFSNQSLEDLVEKKPVSLLDLKNIKGLGAYKISQFGVQIIEVIQNYLQDTGQMLSPLFSESYSSAFAVGEKSEGYQENQKPELVFRVGEFLEFANTLFMQAQVVVQGEVGKVDTRKGYTFFTLLDNEEEAVLQCFIWDHKLRDLGVELVEGTTLKVSGYGKIFKRRGSFSFEVERIALIGEGNLRLAFEQLKSRLATEGYFDPQFKQLIPQYATKIGLITSVQADAKKDFLTHLGNFGLQIFHRDVRVEGLYAVEEISESIRWFNENMPELDVLVLTRGGGSMESLQAFNTETMAKAIRASKIPIVTAIGHENDDTIADWVADKKCSTPTDAGRFLSENWRHASQTLFNSQKWLEQHMHFVINNTRERLEQSLSHLEFIIEQNLKNEKTELHNLQQNLYLESMRWFDLLKIQFQRQAERIRVSDPMKKLAQGYSVVFKNGRVVKSIDQLMQNEQIDVHLYNGKFSSVVKKIETKTDYS